SNTYNMRLQLNNRLQNLKNAKQIHNLSTNRRLNGLIDEIEYLSNKTALNNAQKNLNIAKNSEIQAIITLFKSFGGNLYVSGRNQ
ncbi:MAG: TolC family protein, partial [Helicobacter sp.]|nr:TolC family protein [Helicobacter sp.]